MLESKLTSPILQVEGLSKSFPLRGGTGSIRAVNNVSFVQDAGQTLGIVGESGCGKTTLGRLILRLIEPTSGQVVFDGEALESLNKAELRAVRRHVQMVFQDTFASLDSRMKVGAQIEEPLIIHQLGNAEWRRAEVLRLLAMVGLPADAADRYPHEFSGGQRQRICIARAAAPRPKLVVADEPVSALDVSIQSQILNLLDDLGRELGLSYVFISHDLAVIEHVSDVVAVMYLGEIVELAPAEKIFANPKHPYTDALLSAIPRADPERERTRIVLPGDVPSPESPPSGCPFHPRCPRATDQCSVEVPQTVAVESGHSVRCHLYR